MQKRQWKMQERLRVFSQKGMLLHGTWAHYPKNGILFQNCSNDWELFEKNGSGKCKKRCASAVKKGKWYFVPRLKAVCGIFEQKPKPWLILVQQAKQSKYMYFLHHARAADQKAPYVRSSLKSGNHGYQIKMFSYAAQHLSTLGLRNETTKCF